MNMHAKNRDRLKEMIKVKEITEESEEDQNKEDWLHHTDGQKFRFKPEILAKVKILAQ